jgi:hypothetical protein
MAHIGWLDRVRAAGRSSPVSLTLLIAANVLPLVGVLFLGWDVATILILYWIENGIVGLINFPKVLLATRAANAGRIEGGDYGRALFFLVHYGIFWVVHGVFVFVLTLYVAPTSPDSEVLSSRVPAIAFGALVLLVSHLASFYLNFVRQREYEHITPDAQLLQPYPRMLVLHFTVLLGGLAVISAGQPVGLVALLVVFKTIVDVVLFVFTTQRKTGPKGSETTTGR